MDIDATMARLLVRTLTAPTRDPYTDTWRAYPAHGGWEAESIALSPAEAGLLRELHDLPWCDRCEDFIAPGQSHWTSGSRSFCAEHWENYKFGMEQAGRTVVEVES